MVVPQFAGRRADAWRGMSVRDLFANHEIEKSCLLTLLQHTLIVEVSSLSKAKTGYGFGRYFLPFSVNSMQWCSGNLMGSHV